ncbi:hypothetical protein NIES2101_00290 [Calothrix sp. HK-06]|nr:hypothetical protein NIES2101_00290 [Calothrix sp. HK-06]
MNTLDNDLNRAEPSNLTNSKVYLIDGVLYRYIYKTDSINNPKFVFRPLPGQRKRCDLKLNSTQIYIKVFEVKSLYGQITAECGNEAIQLNLF